MNAQAISSLLAAVILLAIGASVLIRDRSRPVYTTFAALTFTISAWYLARFIVAVTGHDLVRWLSLWPAATIPPVARAFFRRFIAQPSVGGAYQGPRFTLAWTALAYGALIASALTGFHFHKTMWFAIPFAVFVFGVLYRCLYDLYRQYQATNRRVERTRILSLLIGGFITVTLVATDTLPRLGIAWPTIGNVLTILYCYYLSQTLFRHRLLDVNELLGKMFVLAIMVLLLWATFELLVDWVGRGQEGASLLNAVVASFVILILFEPLRILLEGGLNRWMARQGGDLREQVEKLKKKLTGRVETEGMAEEIIDGLQQSKRLTHGSIYLLDSAGSGLDRDSALGPLPPLRIEEGRFTNLLRQLKSGRIDRQRLSQELADQPIEESSRETSNLLIEQLDELHADLIFPMFGSQETEQGPWLLGILCVGDERTAGAFDLDDIDLFRTLAGQAALVIESSQTFQRIVERDRLAAIGEMSAGLAHEIRNPLGAIKGAAQLLSDGSADAENHEFLSVIVEEVDRLNAVVTRFLDYARVKPPAAVEIDINDVVGRTTQLLKQQATEKHRIKFTPDPLVPPVLGDAQILSQVFLNLGLNALQAMKEGGALDILVTRRRRSKLGYGSFAEVRFKDSGPGIPPDQLDKLFIPFFTTKEKGTGLGLAISQRIVNEHNGVIEVHSSGQNGATFSVFLPAQGPSLPSEPPAAPLLQDQ